MSSFSASAPGKLVLSGEYAVLEGATAIAMAINRRATASARISGGSIESLGPGGGDTRLFDAAVRTLSSKPDAGYSYVLDSSAFADAQSAIKLGIGSSAALMVALMSVLLRLVGSDESIVENAARAHREFQGGTGSGVDIATSFAGGLIGFRMGESGPASHEWPDGLHYAVLWSGVSASTREKLERIAATKANCNDLADAAETIAVDWASGNARRLVDAYPAYIESLRRFDVDQRLGVFDAGHADLVTNAEQHEVVYKPCGAGGGDVGIVLGTSEEAVASFVAYATGAGFGNLDMRIDWTGVEPGEAD